jgi:hypothetical protein
MASQSHRICVADSSSCRHLSQVGSSVSRSLKSCPLRWQCPVSSSTTHLSWSLFSSNRSFVRLAEGPDMNPFACLSPVVDSQEVNALVREVDGVTYVTIGHRLMILLWLNSFLSTLRKERYSLFLVSWSGVRLSPLGTSATNWPFVPAPDDRW